MPSFNVEDDSSISSDVILSFTNVQDQLLNKYPNGKFYSEKLATINGLKWEIRLYPNGKSTNLKDNMDIELILLSTNSQDSNIDAECHWSLSNIGKNQNFVGGIKRKFYTVNQSGIDSDFDNGLLKDCTSDCKITIGVMQFIESEDEATFKKENTSVISAKAEISDDEADFKKTHINPLY